MSFKSEIKNPKEPVLKAENLSIAWGDKLVASDISLELFPGEMICLVGRSGSGKTSLFHALSGLNAPKSGAVYMNGNDITGRPGHVSYMLQKDLLLEHRNIIDNVILPLIVRGEKKSSARKKANELFADFGIDGTQMLYPVELSGGMRQRAALLRTYMNNSEVILMDEPFSALDALTRVDMQKWFLNMMDKLGFASILITHDVDEAIALADRIMVLGSAQTSISSHSSGCISGGSSGGSDAQTPSSIVATIEVTCLRGMREDFLLSDEALGIKREVMSYLQAN